MPHWTITDTDAGEAFIFEGTGRQLDAFVREKYSDYVSGYKAKRRALEAEHGSVSFTDFMINFAYKGGPHLLIFEAEVFRPKPGSKPKKKK
jgi:hypothetical protein